VLLSLSTKISFSSENWLSAILADTPMRTKFDRDFIFRARERNAGLNAEKKTEG
jgi:hypothetical protein